ncbi:UNKNOWN [Stylonychia lemnae]|uniref:Uncharacterized protein n=1 Tax=Stylonychia lemnae TaxID=5949 RepID=A0A078BA02_STYLE|nr:UNKNOWN [Stylonychia lemnae]|eukprot:CDW91061.1 UNKNOWN [Stylonychia lemnae]
MVQQLTASELILIQKHLYDSIVQIIFQQWNLREWSINRERRKYIARCKYRLFGNRRQVLILIFKKTKFRPLESFKFKGEVEDIWKARYDFYQKKRVTKLKQLYIKLKEHAKKKTKIVDKSYDKLTAVVYKRNLFSPQNLSSTNADFFLTDKRIPPPHMDLVNEKQKLKKNILEDRKFMESFDQSKGSFHLKSQDQKFKMSNIGDTPHKPIDKLNMTDINFQQNISTERNKFARWLQIQENASYRESVSRQRYQDKLAKYQKKLKKIDMKFKEEEMMRRRTNRSQQIKREKVKSLKEKLYENMEQESYRDYQESVIKKKQNSLIDGANPHHQSKLQLIDQNHNHKNDQSMARIRNNSQISASNHERSYLSANNVSNATFLENDEFVISHRLEIIKERQKRVLDRRVLSQSQIAGKAKEHYDKVQDLRNSYLAKMNNEKLQRWNSLLLKDHKIMQKQKKNQDNLRQRSNYFRMKALQMYEKNQQLSSARNQERDQKLDKIVNQFHKRIDKQIEKCKQQTQVSSLVKKAINDEWFSIYRRNVSKQRAYQNLYSSSIMKRQQEIDATNQKLKDQKAQLVKISLMQNNLRLEHKRKLQMMSQPSSPLRNRTNLLNGGLSNSIIKGLDSVLMTQATNPILPLKQITSHANFKIRDTPVSQNRQDG